MALTPRVREWAARGERVDYEGHGIHAFQQEGKGPLLLLLHGFPSSSYDWRPLLEEIGDRAILAFDCLGFGLSGKPRDHRYSLFEQADLTEELVRRRGGDHPIFILAHDMGTSIATELMARDLEGALEMRLVGALLFNGSIVLERATPTPAQYLLRSPIAPLAARLTSRPVFRHQFGSLFSYMDERIEHAERWHGAIRDWSGALSFAWGLQDPIANTDVLAALRELRPAAPVSELPELGHYPQLEDPGRMITVLRNELERLEDWS